jgi:hypothetical protein
MGSLCCVRRVRVLRARRVTLTIVTRLLPLAKVFLTRCVLCWKRGGLHCHGSLCCRGLLMTCAMLGTIVLLRLGEERQRCWIGSLCCANGGRGAAVCGEVVEKAGLGVGVARLWPHLIRHGFATVLCICLL